MKKYLLVVFVLVSLSTSVLSAPFGGNSVKNIVLKSFFASSDGKSIKLNWELSEMEHDVACMIERSNDGVSFEVIATVNISKGFSGLKSYTDKPTVSGQYYYRLFMFKAGFVPFSSSTISAKLGYNDKTKSTSVSNPIQQQMVVRGGFNNKNIQVEMIDMNGQLKLSQNIGTGHSESVSIDTGKLEKGLYLVRVSERTDAGYSIILTKRIVKTEN